MKKRQKKKRPEMKKLTLKTKLMKKLVNSLMAIALTAGLWSCVFVIKMFI